MNVVKAMREYVSKMLSLAKEGMKVLLLDVETTGMISLVYSQSEVLQEEVYLFERIDTPNREVMAHLKAICFLRPTPENLSLLKKELKKPKYGEYYIFFTNVISKSYLEALASADEHEVVHEVQEFFGDYYAINPDFWSLNLNAPSCLSSKSSGWPASLPRITQGLMSSLLSLRIKPYIRVQKSSEAAIQAAMKENQGLFKMPKEHLSILIILDRRDDPVTPLLTQWTYQAMIHNMIGIDNNLVDMSKCSGSKLEQPQIVLSRDSDPFYKENMYKNFGELGSSIKALASQYQTKAKLNQNINTLDDMKNFVKNYPEFKKLSGNVSKHVSLMEELQRHIKTRGLIEISEIEQRLACYEAHEEAVTNLNKMLAHPTIQPGDLLRLIMLYNLRYETREKNQTKRFISLFEEKFPQEDSKIVQILKSYGGLRQRSPTVDLFSNQSLFAQAKVEAVRGLMGVTNIYSEHVPLVVRVIRDAIENALQETTYQYIDGTPPKGIKPQQIMVFMVGGTTYEEAAQVAALNPNGQYNIILGSTHIVSPTSFISSLHSCSSEGVFGPEIEG